MKKFSKFTVQQVLLILFLSLLTRPGNAQTYFQKVYQSSPFEQEGQDVVAMPDGGYLIAGYTTNSTQYDCNVHILKTDASGNQVWIKNYGGNKPDFPYHMIPTADGNYFLIGYSQSYGGGDVDIYLLKVDQNGDMIWSKTYGGTGNDFGKDIIQTSDGNYLIVGWSNSPTLADQNANLIKIDPAGTVIWSKMFGGSSDDFGNSVKQCSDGGFIMLGQTFSYGTAGDAYLVRTDAAGNQIWYKTFGGSQYDEGVYVNAHSDDSFTLLIRDSSNFGQNIDIRITRTDASGNQVWSKVYGSTEKDTPKMIQPTSDGGYIVAGISRSFGWINPDMWILKCNSGGDTTWSKHFGGVNNEHCYVVREQPDGSYIAVGKTASYGPDMDVIFLKLNSQGNITIGLNELTMSNEAIRLFPNPNNGKMVIDVEGVKANWFTISDMLGQTVCQGSCQNERTMNITMKDQKQGPYVLKLECENGIITKKFIIN
jgi:hypothetical protein